MYTNTYMQRNYQEEYNMLNMEMSLGCVLCEVGQEKGGEGLTYFLHLQRTCITINLKEWLFITILYHIYFLNIYLLILRVREQEKRWGREGERKSQAALLSARAGCRI